MEPHLMDVVVEREAVPDGGRHVASLSLVPAHKRVSCQVVSVLGGPRVVYFGRRMVDAKRANREGEVAGRRERQGSRPSRPVGLGAGDRRRQVGLRRATRARL